MLVKIDVVNMHGLFNHTSRSNHSCNPNAYRVWCNEPINELRHFTFKDIKKNQEITTSYIDFPPKYTFIERQKNL